jgi:hypothetical protein
MRAKRIKPGRSVHPEHTFRSDYAGPQFLERPVGEVVESKDAWMLCVGSNPVAVPADDECAKRVLRVMNSDRRKEFIAELRNLQSPTLFKQLSKAEQERVQHLAEVYAEELTDPEVPAEFENV